MLSVSCASTGDKSSSDSTATASQNKTGSNKGSKKIDPDANRSASSKSRKSTKRQTGTTRVLKPLELPPDLVGSSNDKVANNAAVTPESRVLPEIIGARILNDDGKTWLEIDASVETAWKSITEYWVTRDVTLVDYNPEAGTMETEWIRNEIETDEDGSAVMKLFKNLLTAATNRNTSFDKYRIRFERIGSNKTSMHVAHRVSAKQSIEFSRKESEFEWVELPSDPERVADFMQNIILVFDQSASA